MQLVISHIVLFHFRPEVSEDEIVELMQDIREMKAQIESIVDLHCGKNFTDSKDHYSHALIVIFKDIKGLETYRLHPVHQPIIKKVERMANRAERIDYEF